MALGKLDRVDARLKRQAARQESSGLTPEEFHTQLRDTKRAAKAAYKKECAPFQRRLNAYHAAWVAAGMPKDFPNMAEWEVRLAAPPAGLDDADLDAMTIDEIADAVEATSPLSSQHLSGENS